MEKYCKYVRWKLNVETHQEINKCMTYLYFDGIVPTSLHRMINFYSLDLLKVHKIKQRSTNKQNSKNGNVTNHTIDAAIILVNKW